MYLDITDLTIEIDWQMFAYATGCFTIYFIYKLIFGKSHKKKGKK